MVLKDGKDEVEAEKKSCDQRRDEISYCKSSKSLANYVISDKMRSQGAENAGLKLFQPRLASGRQKRTCLIRQNIHANAWEGISSETARCSAAFIDISIAFDKVWHQNASISSLYLDKVISIRSVPPTKTERRIHKIISNQSRGTSGQRIGPICVSFIQLICSPPPQHLRMTQRL